MKRGFYVAVVCQSHDRLPRKPVHLAIIAGECEKAQTELVIVTEPLDTSPEGQLIAYVKRYAAELERGKIRERTMRGKQSRAVKGMLPQGGARQSFALATTGPWFDKLIVKGCRYGAAHRYAVLPRPNTPGAKT